MTRFKVLLIKRKSRLNHYGSPIHAIATPVKNLLASHLVGGHASLLHKIKDFLVLAHLLLRLAPGGAIGEVALIEAQVPNFHTVEYWESIGFTKDPEALVRRHAAFVQSIAREYFHPSLGVGFEDLLQEGYSGLLEAAGRFRPERGCKFVTYAAWWVRKPILRLISEQSQNIKIPAYRWSGILEARRNRDSRGDQAGSPEGARDARALRALEPLLPLSRGEVSLEETFDTEVALREYLSDSRSPDPLACALGDEVTDLLCEAMTVLDGRERQIVARHYGLEDGEEATLQQIGDELGLTRERIRQIEAEALGKMSRWMRRRERGFPD